MIKITKGPKPQILVTNEASWTATLLAMLASGEPRSDVEKFKHNKYGHKDVKDAAKKETFGKCAYCESKHLHVSHGELDHITPQKIAPQHAFRWDNLVLSCSKCNNSKSDTEGVVDPISENPNEFLMWHGPLIFGRFVGDSVQQDPKGQLTVEKLKLNREELVSERIRQMKDWLRQLREIELAANEQLRITLRQAFISEMMSPSGQFSAYIKSFVAQLQPAALQGG